MTTEGDDDVVLGVDIGGTKVAVGLVNREGTIVAQERKPMIANGTAEAGLEAVTNAIDTFAQGRGVRSIGICAPGPLDPRTGVVINPPNLPCWRNFPLAEKVSAKYRVPVKVENDANAAALAETKWGAARGYCYVFYATIGTGIGTGIVFDGEIYDGNTGSAGEGGHQTIDYRGPRCHCGKLGCIEILAAGPAIGVRARSKFTSDSLSADRLSADPVSADPVSADPGSRDHLSGDRSRHSTILDLANGDVAAITSEMVGKAYAAGDSLAEEILNETANLLTVWLGNMVDLLDPDVLVVGGGVAAMLRPFFDQIKNNLPKWCVNPHASEIPLVMAHYGADAGIAGGAALCS